MKYALSFIYLFVLSCNASVQGEIAFEKIVPSFSIISVAPDTPIIAVANTQGMIWRDDLHFLTCIREIRHRIIFLS